MAKVGKALESVLEGYASFLRERMLAPLKHQPYLVRWVQEFLLFAEEHRGYTFEQTLDLFLVAVGERVGIKPWQIHKQRLQCASTAINIHVIREFKTKTQSAGYITATCGWRIRRGEIAVHQTLLQEAPPALLQEFLFEKIGDLL